MTGIRTLDDQTTRVSYYHSTCWHVVHLLHALPVSFKQQPQTGKRAALIFKKMARVGFGIPFRITTWMKTKWPPSNYPRDY